MPFNSNHEILLKDYTVKNQNGGRAHFDACRLYQFNTIGAKKHEMLYLTVKGGLRSSHNWAQLPTIGDALTVILLSQLANLNPL